VSTTSLRANGRLAEGTLEPVDRTRLEVLRHYLLGAGEEIWHTLRRAAYSINIKERGDCSSAIFDAAGETLAIPPTGIPIHQGSLGGLVAELLRRYDPGEIGPGDMFVTNDAYTGGTHANDYCLVAPVHSLAGELVAFVANVGHHSDVGGRVGCSIAADAASVFEEGVLVPPVRLVREGLLVDEVLEIIAHNSRERTERTGDLHAQISANRVGVRRVSELVEDLGARSFRRYADALLEYGCVRMRSVLEALPDGEWEAVDAIDGDGVEAIPIPLRLIVRKRGGTLVLDWSELPGQVRGGRNVLYTTLAATCFCVLRGLLDPDMPLNGGFHRTVELVAPPGSLVNPQHPAAVGDRATTAQVLADLVANCASQMSGQRQLAASGSFQGWAFEGRRSDGRPYTIYESVAGGMGASDAADGIDAVRSWPLGSMNAPIEAYEQEAPAVFRRYSLLPDSGGPGRFQGGLGLRRDVEIRGYEVRMTTYTMRRLVPPPGLAEGRPGSPCAFVLNPGSSDETRLPPVITGLPIAYGAVVSSRTPGGGGFGPPAEREPAHVRRDLAEGRISAEFADEHYGDRVSGG
jgi:N-methylhydantoinase B